jgi:hypothetical protein
LTTKQRDTLGRGTRKPLTEDDPRHGTINAYCNLKCRCTPCRKEWAAYVDRLRHARRLKPGDGDHRHGTSNGYGNYNCRCVPCTRAWSAAGAVQYKRRLAKAASGAAPVRGESS